MGYYLQPKAVRFLPLHGKEQYELLKLLNNGCGNLLAKAPKDVMEIFRKNPTMLKLPLEPMHGWRSSPDEGDHSHCWFCKQHIYFGDPVVGCYLEYVSIVFCPKCVHDNPELFREWLASKPV